MKRWMILVLVLALAVLAGCAKKEEKGSEPQTKADNTTTTTKEEAETLDLTKFQKLSDLFEYDFCQSTASDSRYVYVFESDGIYYRALAKLTSEMCDKIWNLDYSATDHIEQEQKLVADLPIEKIENLSELIPTQEELNQWVGKKGSELMDAGWSCFMTNTEDMTFWLNYGPFMYEVVFEGEVKDPMNFDEDEDMKNLTVKSVTYMDLGDASDILQEEE